MDIISLLGKKLKSDPINTLFELYDVDVSYQYDRLEENTPDSYSASIDERGLEFSFNSEQILSTVFIKNEIDVDGVIRFSSVEDVESYSHDNALNFDKGSYNFLGVMRKWIKLFYSNYSIHYEFKDSNLSMVTLEVVGA